MTLEAAINVDYDLCDPRIRCHADKLGAEVYTFHDSLGHEFRALAFDYETARDIFHNESWEPWL
jgi:hypothetical protein